MTFENGYRVSVQFSPLNQGSSNHDLRVDPPDISVQPKKWNTSSSAEVVVISPDGNMVQMYRNQKDTVLYNVNPELLAGIIHRVSEFEGACDYAYSS
tara:strand:- start:107 stop:397 length:291 start_codon:yes stop_codon:yes gene_type:complete